MFADPKTDFVFKRIFGNEAHKHLLIALLNDLLELDPAHRIVDLDYLPADQRVPVAELKLSILDVKCTDARGTRYVVEMQILNVEGFEKRVVYNVCKAFVTQLRKGDEYPRLHDVVGVTLCDFHLWPEPSAGLPAVPMLSRWRMQEQHHGAVGLGQVQYVFLELPKYAAGTHPQTVVEKWAYFFREADNWDVVPAELQEAPFTEALEGARLSSFSAGEWEAYDRAAMAEQDARGALQLAHQLGLDTGRQAGLDEGRRAGLDEGRKQGLQTALRVLCEVHHLSLSPERQAQLAACTVPELEALLDTVKTTAAWPW